MSQCILKYYCVALLCAVQFVHAQSDSVWQFIQLTDPQFGMYPLSRHNTQERRNFSSAVQYANRLHPEFVVICGDLTNAAGDKKQIQAFNEIRAQLDSTIPLFLVAGNHDITNHPTREVLEAYRKRFGPDYYTFVRHGFTFVILNSTLLKDPSKAQAEAFLQEQWIDSTLQDAAHRKSPVVIFQHHPWFIKSVDENDSYFGMPNDVRKKYFALFKKYGVTHIFSGHLHRNLYALSGGIECISSGSVGMPLSFDPSGLCVVTVQRDKITHRYYSLRSLPK